jgi:dTDP-glucose pyrophosphorylase
VEEHCDRLGIRSYEIIDIQETDGQATTALKAESRIEDAEDILIYNIDTYIEEGHLRKKDIEGDGWLPVFTAHGDKWSFVKLKDGEVTQVAEKEPISNLATVGLYHFGSMELFKEAYNSLSRSVKEEYGEVYIAPLYNYLIEQGKKVTVTNVDKDDIHVLGTPEDVLEFYPQFKDDWNLQ